MSVRQQTSDVNYLPSINQLNVKEDIKFKYATAQFANGVTTTQAVIDKENNFAKAGDLYRSFSKKDQDNLISNLSGALNAVANKEIVKRMVAHFYQADKSYGDRLLKNCNLKFDDIKNYIK